MNLDDAITQLATATTENERITAYTLIAAFSIDQLAQANGRRGLANDHAQAVRNAFNLALAVIEERIHQRPLDILIA